jgi:tmRNA-binding protein
MKKRELAKILEATAQKGQACVCTQLYWKGHLVKARLALAVGKKRTINATPKKIGIGIAKSSASCAITCASKPVNLCIAPRG